MAISQEAIQKILGLKGNIYVSPKEMARNLKVTVFPYTQKISGIVKFFCKRLKEAMEDLGVEVIPFEKAKIGGKIKEKIAVISMGVGREGDLPIDNVVSPLVNPILTIIEMPSELNEDTPYEKHMEISLNLFSYLMSNTVICVDSKKWIVYHFNGFSSFYRMDRDFESNVLRAIIPKLAANVSFPTLSDFKIKRTDSDFLDDKSLYPYMKDMVECGDILSKTGLFSPPRSIDSLRFRNEFYKRLVYSYLDERSGMSYGFVVRQLPTKLKRVLTYKEAKCKLGMRILKNKDFLIKDKKIYLLLEANKKAFLVEVPPVWVLMTRSGSEKTKLDPYKDILKIGLMNGEMLMEIPPSVNLQNNYKPSFDTRVILSHSLANVVFLSLLAYFREDSLFPKILERDGLALIHWHGKVLPEFVPRGYYLYGENNPAVPLSSQSALYAFWGKEEAIKKNLSMNTQYLGDIHVEPHHGINMTGVSLRGLGYYLLWISSNLKITMQL